MKKRASLVFTLIACALLSSCGGVDYAKEMQRALEKTFKHQYNSYQFFGMPVSNFGVGTMYPKPALNEDFDPTRAGLYGDPNTWWKAGLSEEKKKELLKELFPGGGTGPMALQFDTSKKFDIDVVFPALYTLLSVNGGANYKKNVKVSLSMGNAENHRINWSSLDEDFNKGLIKDSVRRHYQAGDFLITADDVVLHDYQASLVVMQNLDTNAKAQLSAAWKAFSKDTSAALDFSSGENGNFSVKAKAPVVAAVFIGAPPSQQTRSVKSAEDLEHVILPRTVMLRIMDVSVKGTALPSN